MGRPDWAVVRLFDAPSRVVLYNASQIVPRNVYPIPWLIAILPSWTKMLCSLSPGHWRCTSRAIAQYPSRLTVSGRMDHFELPDWG